MLTICPTPIGNLDDVTPRQRTTLRDADIVACEDTRRTGKLFELLGIPRAESGPRFVSYHEHNESERVPELIAALKRGESVVLVSDAGTPAISDPGWVLVNAARSAELPVTVLPGPVAAAVALAGSGLPAHRWTFYGFAPTSSGARRELLSEARRSRTSAVFYESPHRIIKFLADVVSTYGADHEVCVARELTKRFEEWLVGAASEVADDLGGRARVKGELVVVLAPAEVQPRDDVDDWIAAMVRAGIKPSTIKAVVADVSGLPKSEVFDRMERLK